MPGPSARSDTWRRARMRARWIEPEAQAKLGGVVLRVLPRTKGNAHACVRRAESARAKAKLTD